MPTLYTTTTARTDAAASTMHAVAAIPDTAVDARPLLDISSLPLHLKRFTPQVDRNQHIYLNRN
jgi:hypothetical protein